MPALSTGDPSAVEPSTQLPEPHDAWVIIESIPDIVEDEKIVPPGTDVLLEYEDPPLATTIAVHKRVALDQKASTTVVAVHRSGRFLLCTDHGGKANHEYFISDAQSRLATRLPPCTETISSGVPRYSVGFIADPRGAEGDFIVAELQPAGSTHHRQVLCYSTSTKAWALKKLASSPYHPPWRCNGSALALGNKVWWVDTNHGLLNCDPSLDTPDLRYVALPSVDEENSAGEDLSKYRCVMASQSKLRYVQIHDIAEKPKITVWTLGDDPEGPVWEREYQVLWTEIWGNETYAAAGLPPQKVPAIALIHPRNVGIIYFFHDKRLFAVDMRAAQRRVLAHENYTTDFVMAWELPRVLLQFDPAAHKGVSIADEEATSCLVCGIELSGKCACDSCVRRLSLLLNKLKETSKKVDCICLSCGSLGRCKRVKCSGFLLALSREGPNWIGWLTGNELWAGLIIGVQVDRAYYVGTPIYLHPPEGKRCIFCKDLLGAKSESLYGTSEYCSCNCWQEGEKDSPPWASVLCSTKFTGRLGSHDSFCTTCAQSFTKKLDLCQHKEHISVKVILVADKSCLQIAPEHTLASSLLKIKHIDEEVAEPSASLVIPLHPRSSRRCVRCKICLVEGGGTTCSFGCALGVPLMKPRVLQLRNRTVLTT